MPSATAATSRGSALVWAQGPVTGRPALAPISAGRAALACPCAVRRTGPATWRRAAPSSRRAPARRPPVRRARLVGPSPKMGRTTARAPGSGPVAPEDVRGRAAPYGAPAAVRGCTPCPNGGLATPLPGARPPAAGALVARVTRARGTGARAGAGRPGRPYGA